LGRGDFRLISSTSSVIVWISSIAPSTGFRSLRLAGAIAAFSRATTWSAVIRPPPRGRSAGCSRKV
jgi:hypothetical protein